MCVRGVAQPGSAPGLGPGGRRFESCRPDIKKGRTSCPVLCDYHPDILGLVGYWDVVAWDEFEQQKGRNVDAVLIDTIQNYLANKSFNRGKGTHEASASMVFV